VAAVEHTCSATARGRVPNGSREVLHTPYVVIQSFDSTTGRMLEIDPAWIPLRVQRAC
jgi:hypothetical protein